jgi:transcriptional regulator with XRE-family HTH domain
MRKGWTQAEAAARLGVSQGYWSLLETGRRAVPARLLPSLRRQLPVPPTTAPLNERAVQAETAALARAIAVLGYPGFAHLKRGNPVNPAVVLLVALRMPDLDTRVVEALPWVAGTHADLDWHWLIPRAKVDDLQNRLGFVVGLACEVATRAGDDVAVDALAQVLQTLDGSRLVKDDTLCRSSMPTAERRYLASARSALARHWNLLSDLTTDALPYVG